MGVAEGPLTGKEEEKEKTQPMTLLLYPIEGSKRRQQDTRTQEAERERDAKGRRAEQAERPRKGWVISTGGAGVDGIEKGGEREEGRSREEGWHSSEEG